MKNLLPLGVRTQDLQDASLGSYQPYQHRLGKRLASEVRLLLKFIRRTAHYYEQIYVASPASTRVAEGKNLILTRVVTFKEISFVEEIWHFQGKV